MYPGLAVAHILFLIGVGRDLTEDIEHGGLASLGLFCVPSLVRGICKEDLLEFPEMDGLGARDADQESVAVVEVDAPDFVGFDASPEFFDEISSFAGEDADDGSLVVRISVE